MSTKTPGQTLYENAEPIFAWDELATQAKERHEKMAQAVLTAHAPKITSEVNGSAHNITKIYTMENSNAQLDSPETDAHRPFSGTKIELLVEKDFARQLELQRDAFSDALVVVMAERDTARAELSQERLVVQGALASESRAVNHANELMVELAKVKGELEEEEQKKEAAHRVIRIHDFGVNEDLKSQLEASQKEVEQWRHNWDVLMKERNAIVESQAGGRLTPRVLQFDELIQEGDFYVPGSGGLCKVDAQHFGNRANNWPVAFIRFVSPWHIIDPANPATLPTKEDADSNEQVLFRFEDNEMTNFLWRHEWLVETPVAWMSIPPLPTPPVPPAQDAFAAWYHDVEPPSGMEKWLKAAYAAAQAQGGDVK